MKRVLKQTFLILCLCLIFSLPGRLCFAENEGYLDVKVIAPETFTHSIMINLIDNNGINHVITAERINSWKSNYPLPEGEYVVDYVSFDVMDNSYEAQYPDLVSVTANSGVLFEIDIKSIKSQSTKIDKALESQTENKRTESKGFGLMVANLLKQIVCDNYITIIAIIAILIFLIKRRRARNGEEY